MRKNKLKMIKETTERLHRRKGTQSLAFSDGITTEQLRFFKIFGNTEIDENENIIGVGNSKDNGIYSISIKIGSSNLLGGAEFAQIHIASKVSTVKTLSDTEYICAPKATYNGTQIINSSVIPFKKRTAYTIAASIRYFNNETSRNIKLRFDYDDGTFDIPTLPINSMSAIWCVSSNPEKTLIAISSYSPNGHPIAYSLEKFGIYEGEYSSFDEVHEPYISEQCDIYISSPLLRVGYSSDELDMLERVIKRKIYKLDIDTKSPVEATETEAYFKMPLPYKRKAETNFICPQLQKSYQNVIYFNEDETEMIFKVSDNIKTLEKLSAFLENSKITICYVMNTPIFEAVEPNLTLPDKKFTLTISTDVPAYKSVMEYV